MTIGRQIKQIREQFKLSQAGLGKRLGVSRDVISNVEYERTEPTELLLRSICREFNIDYVWLTTGEGEMFSSSDDDFMAAVDRIMANESEFARKVFKGLSRWDENDWQTLKSLLDKLEDK